MICWIVTCDECGKDLGWDVKDMPCKSAQIIIETHKKPCEECYQTKEEKDKYRFCSVECMKKFAETFEI